MFRFKCIITRRGKAPVTRIFKCKGSDEAKTKAGEILPPHLYQQAWMRNSEHTRWRKSSDWCSVVLEAM